MSIQLTDFNIAPIIEGVRMKNILCNIYLYFVTIKGLKDSKHKFNLNGTPLTNKQMSKLLFNYFILGRMKV